MQRIQPEQLLRSLKWKFNGWSDREGCVWLMSRWQTPFRSTFWYTSVALCFCVLSCFCAGTSVPPMLQGASDIPQRPEMENPALWKQMSSWILFVPADPPVVVTDVCLGKIVPLIQDAVKSLQAENRTSRLRCGYCATHSSDHFDMFCCLQWFCHLLNWHGWNDMHGGKG